MIFSVRAGDFGRVYDRHGNELQELIDCDTTTGWSTKFLRSPIGRFFIRDDELVTYRVRFAAPLTFVRGPT